MISDLPFFAPLLAMGSKLLKELNDEPNVLLKYTSNTSNYVQYCNYVL